MMTADFAAEISRNAILVAFTICGPLLLAAVLTGVAMSLLQTVTQLQEQTLLFVPKLIVMTFVILYLLPWGLSRLTEYATDLIRNIPGTV